MLHSLEVRAPFLDIELVDFLRRLPARMKLRGGTSKWILRRSAATLLPEQVLTRSKQGFAVPIGQWLRDDRLPPVPALRNADFWAACTAAHRAGKSDQRMPLWGHWILAASHLGRAPA